MLYLRAMLEKNKESPGFVKSSHGPRLREHCIVNMRHHPIARRRLSLGIAQNEPKREEALVPAGIREISPAQHSSVKRQHRLSTD